MSTDSERDASTDRLLNAALRPLDLAVSDACLDAETLAAWADGQVYGQDADPIEAHLADCARCQAMLAAFAQSEAVVEMAVPAEAPAPAPAVIPFRPRRTLRWFVPAAVGTLAAGLLIWTAVRPTIDVPAPPMSVAKVELIAPASPTVPAAPAETTAKANQPRAASVPAASPAAIPAPPARAAAPPAVSPTPAVLAAPPPPVAPPAGAVQVTSATDLVRTQTPVTTQSVSANFTQTLPRSDRSAVGYLVTLAGGGIEFGPPADPANEPATLTMAAGGGGGGRGGGGGGRAAGATAVAQKTTPVAPSPPGPIRWRVAPSGQVTKSIDAGTTWTAVAVEPSTFITSGSAPSASVCWLIGRGGLVLLSIDGTGFRRITFPEAVDLRSITAIDARQATVTTSAGRVFTTTDGGATWK